MAGNYKHYIDYVNKVRDCGNCKVRKPFSEFPLLSSGNPRTHCKKCHSWINGLHFKRKNAKLRPYLYYECSNELCGWIWSKKESGRCRHCRSEGVDYKEVILDEA